MRLCMSDQMDCGLSQQPLCAVYIFERDAAVEAHLDESGSGSDIEAPSQEGPSPSDD